MIETVIMIGVLGNFLLQSAWFIWSYQIHNRKHFTDDNEIELYDRVMVYVDNELNKREKIREEKRTSSFMNDFNTPRPKPSTVTPNKVEVNPLIDDNELSGAISNFFGGSDV